MKYDEFFCSSIAVHKCTAFPNFLAVKLQHRKRKVFTCQFCTKTATQEKESFYLSILHHLKGVANLIILEYCHLKVFAYHSNDAIWNPTDYDGAKALKFPSGTFWVPPIGKFLLLACANVSLPVNGNPDIDK